MAIFSTDNMGQMWEKCPKFTQNQWIAYFISAEDGLISVAERPVKGVKICDMINRMKEQIAKDWENVNFEGLRLNFVTKASKLDVERAVEAERKLNK